MTTRIGNETKDRRWLIMFCLLGLASAIVLASAANSLSPSEPESSSARQIRSVETARAFYEAVNEALRTGDTLLLEPLLAPTFAEPRQWSTSPANKNEFIGWLKRMHSTIPWLQVIVDSAWASTHGDEVTVHLTAVGAKTGKFLGLDTPVELAKGWWGPIEILRIQNDRVVERLRGHTPGSDLLPFVETALPAAAPGERRLVALIRVTISPGSDQRIFNGNSQRTVIVESGTVTLTLEATRDRFEPPLQSGQPGLIVVPVQAAQSVEISRSAVMQTPTGATFTLVNNGRTAADLLLVVRYGLGWGTDLNGLVTQDLWFDVATINTPPPSPVVARVLTYGVIKTNEYDVASLGWVTLDPGATLTWAPVPGALLVYVESGQLFNSTTGSASRSESNPAYLNVPPVIALPAGDGSWIPEGFGAAWYAAGDEPVRVLMLAIVPASD